MKLTKKVALAANDDIQAKIGFKPELDTKLKTDKLYAELHQKIVDVEIDEDDREDLEDSTCEVIDALAEMFDGAEAEEAEAPEVEKEVEETEAETEAEEKPKKKKKEKKSQKSKGKVDPVELAEEIKTNKKINRDGLYEIVNENADLFGDDAETLLTITNPMVLKKQMRNVLEGGEIEMTKTKKPTKKAKAEKKEKAPKEAPEVVEVSLTEKVNAFEDLDELKAFAKENKKSFPGVKAKKFDKLKKLRKALLKVVVEDAPKKGKKKKGKTAGKDLETVRAERQKRIDWITDFLNKEGGKVGRKKLTALALKEFPNPAKSIRDIISYAKNPKYNKFEKLMVEHDGVIGWEDAFEEAKPKKAKKAKKEEKERKEKPEKKDKKKKKKGKKSKK